MARIALQKTTPETLLSALRSHPEWTLAQALEVANTTARKLLPRVRVGDLWTGVDPQRLARAQKLHGDPFDACVLAVIREAPRTVSGSYLRARVGGPRYKLRGALGRLLEFELRDAAA